MDSAPPEHRAPSLRSRAMWFVRARPCDYLLAISESYASLPVIGKHLEPIGGLTAMGVWGSRHAPDFLSSAVRNALIPGAAETRRRQREQTNDVVAAALRGAVSAERLNVQWPGPERMAP